MKKKLVEQLGGSLNQSSKEFAKNIKILENHLIQVQENQVEFEKYLCQLTLIVKAIAIKVEADYETFRPFDEEST